MARTSLGRGEGERPPAHGDRAGGRVDPDRVARPIGRDRGGAFHQQQALVDGRAVEDAGKALGHDRRHAGRLQADDRLLARAAAAEILAGQEQIAGPDLGREPPVEVFQQVRQDLLRLRAGVGVLAGKEHVGVDVVAVLPDMHGHISFRGSRIKPWIAEAATVAGLAK